MQTQGRRENLPEASALTRTSRSTEGKKLLSSPKIHRRVAKVDHLIETRLVAVYTYPYLSFQFCDFLSQ